jgi:hypothetical protein
MKFYHVTDLTAAKQIVKYKEFLTYHDPSGMPNHDACLNCFNDSKTARVSPQPLHDGVIIVLKWSGPIKKYTEWEYCLPYVMYDNSPWRYFIPLNTTKYLKIVNIYFDKDYIKNMAINIVNTKYPQFIKYLPEKIREYYYKKELLLLYKDIRKMINDNKNNNISVI